MQQVIFRAFFENHLSTVFRHGVSPVASLTFRTMNDKQLPVESVIGMLFFCIVHSLQVTTKTGPGILCSFQVAPIQVQVKFQEA